MPLIKNRYGKGRVRVMRIHRDGDRHEVSQLSVKAMIEGDFARAYTHADNSTSVATDTIKNIVNVVARENTGLSTEEFCQVLAKRYLDTYPQIASVAISAHETKWSRLSFGGKPHPHSFVLDSNGKPFVEASVARGGQTALTSGIDGFAFMKSTQSGWENYPRDRYTTLPETADRMCATSMVASWKWSGRPCELSGGQCADSRHLARSVQHDLQHERAGQPVPDGRGGAGGRAGNLGNQHGLPEHALHSDEPVGIRAG